MIDLSLSSVKNQDRYAPATRHPALIGHKQRLRGSARSAGGDRYFFDGRRFVRLLRLVRKFIDQKGFQKSAGFQKPIFFRQLLQRGT